MRNINAQIRNGDYLDSVYPDVETFTADLTLAILEDPIRTYTLSIVNGKVTATEKRPDYLSAVLVIVPTLATIALILCL